MDKLPEFAEQSSTRERVRHVVIGIFVGVPVVAICKLWLFPSIREFSESAACRSVFGIPGPTVLFYGLLVGVPLLFALLAGLSFSFRGYKILRDGQTPPLGEKVFRPTRIVRGPKARLVGRFHLMAPVPLLALAVWGSFQATELSTKVASHPPKCVANPSLQRTASGVR